MRHVEWIKPSIWLEDRAYVERNGTQTWKDRAGLFLLKDYDACSALSPMLADTPAIHHLSLSHPALTDLTSRLEGLGSDFTELGASLAFE